MSDVPPDDWRCVRNIGPVTVHQLRSIGIDTPAQLFELGAAEVYCRLKRSDPERVTRTMLWALAGAELDIDWRQVPTDVKTELLRDVSCKQPSTQSAHLTTEADAPEVHCLGDRHSGGR